MLCEKANCTRDNVSIIMEGILIKISDSKFNSRENTMFENMYPKSYPTAYTFLRSS